MKYNLRPCIDFKRHFLFYNIMRAFVKPTNKVEVNFDTMYPNFPEELGEFVDEIHVESDSLTENDIYDIVFYEIRDNNIYTRSLIKNYFEEKYKSVDGYEINFIDPLPF